MFLQAQTTDPLHRCVLVPVRWTRTARRGAQHAEGATWKWSRSSSLCDLVWTTGSLYPTPPSIPPSPKPPPPPNSPWVDLTNTINIPDRRLAHLGVTSFGVNIDHPPTRDWPEGNYPPTYLELHAVPVDFDSLLSPVPGQGLNANRDTTLAKCRALCDTTFQCNQIVFVPATPATNTRPGCYMYWFVPNYQVNEQVQDHDERRFREPAEAALGIAYGAFDVSNFVIQKRECPLGDVDANTNADGSLSALASSITNYAAVPSVAFGDDTDNADVKIAFVDGDDRADVITVSGRDHVKVYRGTEHSQFTGDFSRMVPETLAASALRARRAQDPYSRFPGNAEVQVELASALQVFVADFDNDGDQDLFVHAPAPSAGSCAQRCHSIGRFGYDSFELRHANVAHDDEAEPTYCYCGPHYDLMIGPGPPPSPPAPPPSPSEPPAPPPTPAPDIPPPSPPFPCAKCNLECNLEQVDTIPHAHMRARAWQDSARRRALHASCRIRPPSDFAAPSALTPATAQPALAAITSAAAARHAARAAHAATALAAAAAAPRRRPARRPGRRRPSHRPRRPRRRHLLASHRPFRTCRPLPTPRTRACASSTWTRCSPKSVVPRAPRGSPSRRACCARASTSSWTRPYIEQIIVAKLSCPEMFDNGLSSYGSNVSRASVNFQVNPKKPDCAHPDPRGRAQPLEHERRLRRHHSARRARRRLPL